MSALELRGISKAFSSEQVLRAIDLDVAAGDFMTLLGPSGCGKTTLLRIIAGLEHPDEGKLVIGENCFVDSRRGVFVAPQRRRLGFVFQDYGLWPHLSIAENVAFPLKMAKVPRARIARRVGEVLDIVRLGEHAKKVPEQLSGGQKQRVSIARALAGEPKVILFDEPLSNLDANLRVELGREIRLISKQLGLTCVNVTHDRREAQVLSDRIALMKDGVVHQCAIPEVLFRKPKDAWTARFLDAGNILPAAMVLGGDLRADVEVLAPRGAFIVQDDKTGHEARVLNCVFLEDRYEITAAFQGLDVQFYSARPFDTGQTMTFTFDESRIVPL
ncbi:ABC transporter ATP-binding protein [Varunaivibrio sulfuroxidans]|uniref:Iron(III) transport system ATP-binding protein n=1 Tax=Varunaivibrio sulfuroxidans TaxID=1773489 RepID=A0A4R3JHA6_9PROT|nr:ABC transporter ATP-binding protein [Varunaivibrio sulfuroxidans]TCS64170.1 iron(III) transport system ATP-binding protein [Varunaivibrio sulfuroxidans]WES31384.1 ABC transporter ATP-binding protein [Varunaivibrio sulfuroxidans]